MHLSSALPSELLATDQIPLGLSTGIVQVPLCRPYFTAYTGDEQPDTFGGKELLLVDGRPQFAEVAILRAFETAGWQGRWLETYGKAAMRPALWRNWQVGGQGAQEHHPITEVWVNEQLNTIARANNNSFSGCWDVVAWNRTAAGDDRLVFAESKKQKKDRMRGTQLRWLEAALKCGCAVDDFLIVEWSLA